ncbi:YopX family protein [Lentilactobacillus senioris]|uniref:YopX family protein n=1 Tax=Lentilactobacillus senioris TaxID=931534 RepID=UPI003D2AA3C0
MRDIKFRAFEKSLGMTLPVDAIDFCENYVVVHIEDNYMEWYLNDAILEQYTGLKDAEDVEIYENDVIETFDGIRGYVAFEDGTFSIRIDDMSAPLSNYLIFGDLSADVIGNIHQNPELLEE